MKIKNFFGMASTLGVAMVGLVIGSGCQPPPQDVPGDPPAVTPGDEVENPSTTIDTDPDHEADEAME